MPAAAATDTMAVATTNTGTAKRLPQGLVK
jgi:hypothetical protein